MGTRASRLWDDTSYLMPVGMVVLAVVFGLQPGAGPAPPVFWLLFAAAAAVLLTWGLRRDPPSPPQFAAFAVLAGACAWAAPRSPAGLLLMMGGAGTAFIRHPKPVHAAAAALAGFLISEAATLRLAGTALGPVPVAEGLIKDYLFFYAIAFASRQRRLRQLETERLLRELEGQHARLEAAHAELQAYASHAAELAASEERGRLAREIHDVLAHTLTVIIVQADAAAVRLQRDAAGAAEQVRTVASLARQALQEARLSVAAIRADPGAAGVDALRRLCEDAGRLAGLRCELRLQGRERPLPAPVALAAYRIAQEALTNARRHGLAERAEVNLAFGGDSVRLTVRDDGRGPGPGDGVAGMGMRGMAERARDLGGEFAAGPGPDGRGFFVSAELPLGAIRPAVRART